MSAGIIASRMGRLCVRKLHDIDSRGAWETTTLPVAKDERVRVLHDMVPYFVSAGDIEDAMNDRNVSAKLQRLLPTLRECLV